MKGHEPTHAIRTVAVVVAHPDDEILWAGGLLLLHPEWSVVVAALCRGGDADRAPRFHRAMARLGARGRIGDLDDGPEQTPQEPARVEALVQALLPGRDFDLILTHAPEGEYSRHLRHEETSRAVTSLLVSGALRCRALWTFAYEDGGGAHLPRARLEASLFVPLPDPVWEEKSAIITGIYGFRPTSWEARATPREEAFQKHGPPFLTASQPSVESTQP